MASEYSPTTAQLFSTVQSAMTRANNEANRIAGSRSPNLKEPNFSHTVNAPVIEPPPKFGELFPDNSDTATLSWLDNQAEDWLGRFFPNITQCLRTLPDDWLCDVISGVKPLGYSQTYFELAWHSARDRAQRTRRNEVATLDADFSMRGFSLPPGAYVAAVDQAAQRAADVVLEVNREQAMKDIEIKYQMLIFAEEQALNYKLGIFRALADFYRMWLEVPDKDLERARIRAQAMSSLYSALSSYYDVEIKVEQLRLQAKQIDAEVDLDVSRNRIAAYGADNSANPALGQATRAFADIASAAANAAGTLVAQVESV